MTVTPPWLFVIVIIASASDCCRICPKPFQRLCYHSRKFWNFDDCRWTTTSQCVTYLGERYPQYNSHRILLKASSPNIPFFQYPFVYVRSDEAWCDHDCCGLNAAVTTTTQPTTTTSAQESHCEDDVTCGAYDNVDDVCSKHFWGEISCPRRCGFCSEVQIKHVEPTSHNVGETLILHNGIWGYACADGWTYLNSQVVCTMEGKPNMRNVVAVGQWNFYLRPIFMSGVSCTGYETNLANCKFSGFGKAYCPSNKAIFVQCYGDAHTSVETPIVLSTTSTMKPNTRLTSTVETTAETTTETIVETTAEATTETTAETTAKTTVETTTETTVETTAETTAEKTVETTTETTVETTTKTTAEKTTETTTETTAETAAETTAETTVETTAETTVETTTETTTPGKEAVPVRLVNGQHRGEGRVEVFYNGSWGTVCDDSWDDDDATVVCSMLGFIGEGSVHLSKARFFGRGEGKIWMDEVDCDGTEVNLGYCHFDGFGRSDCDHFEDAGVICKTAIEEVTTSTPVVSSTSTEPPPTFVWVKVVDNSTRTPHSAKGDLTWTVVDDDRVDGSH